MVWDNMNINTKHRVERTGDRVSDSRLDWVGSLWVQDRVSVNHMDNRQGTSLKKPEDLNIEDMVPTEKELDYVFQSMVHYFSYRLLQRHPNLFKTIATAIKENQPHQFQNEMDGKSKEFTGKLFTKSESNMEDLISMMSEVQIRKGFNWCLMIALLRWGPTYLYILLCTGVRPSQLYQYGI